MATSTRKSKTASDKTKCMFSAFDVKHNVAVTALPTGEVVTYCSECGKILDVKVSDEVLEVIVTQVQKEG